MSLARTRILAALALGLTSTQCNLILGLDNIVDGPGTGGAASATSSTQATTSGTGGTGGGPICTGNQTMSCYSGPPGTEGKGICKPGTATCLPDGGAFGPCVGDMVPDPKGEDCTTPGDEDCDGIACSDPVLAELSDNSTYVDVTGIAVDTQGNIFFAGVFNGTATFGATTLVTAGSGDYYLAKFDKTGTVQWAKRFGDAVHNGTQPRIATDSMGNVVMAGGLKGSADFGAGSVQSKGAEDVFVVKFDPMGNYKWGQYFGDASAQVARTVVVDSQGDVIVGGGLTGTVNFGAMTFSCVGNQYDAFLVKLASANGAHLWSKQFTEAPAQVASNQNIYYSAVDSSNNVIVTGFFNGSANFGGSSFMSPLLNIVVAKYDSTGKHSWSQAFAATGANSLRALATDSAGEAIVVGDFNGTLDLGGGPLTTQPGSTDMFIVKFDAGGTHKWSKSFMNVNTQYGLSVATDKAKNIVITGGAGVVDFGLGALPNAGGIDTFLASFDTTGKLRWNKSFGDVGDQFGQAVATDPTTNEIVMAANQGTSTVDYGTGALTSTGMYGIVLGKFQP
jgi:hypothetical protein